MNGYFKTAIRRSLQLAIICLIFGVQLTEGQNAGNVAFDRIEAMVPMRDGVNLFTVILAPKDANEALPILMQRTPYGVDRWSSDRVNTNYRELVADGYIFVFQDIRGKYNSE